MSEAPVLAPAQDAVARRVLAEEGESRHHLVVALSGAHAYGFPSPDSDLDLKAVHVAPTTALLGLSPPPQSASRIGVEEGVEIDYSSNEIGPVVAGILAGNGNYIERILGPHLLTTSADLPQLAELTRAALSRRVHRHYRGFAMAQWSQVERSSAPTAKSVLYVMRTALTGTHALLAGEIVTDVRRLVKPQDAALLSELLERKRVGERAGIEAGEAARWQTLARSALMRLDTALAQSSLPPEPTNLGDMESWLLDLRRRNW